MKSKQSGILTLTLVTTVILAMPNLYAGELTVPHTFTSNTAALASEVNANFSAVSTQVNDNDSRIATLEATIATLQSTVSTLQGQLSTISGSNIMALEPYVTVADDSRGPIATFTGINLQLVNGSGQTESANGLGNLIIGYDRPRDDDTFFCSYGIHEDESACSGAGETWAVSHKSGSHYLVIGDRNNYSVWGGMVVGHHNTSNNVFASVAGGIYNTASGRWASVTSGDNNTASGVGASVSGGTYNISSSAGASVSGGRYNTANSYDASVSGGSYNTARGIASSVNGGGDGTQSGGNVADTDYSSILGGVGQSTGSESQTIPALP